jgi:hypothetical protein
LADPPVPAISGFLIVRDGVRFGYPFLEAIRSALPVCDEIWVADGGSSDGTWEALQVLAAAEPRVKLVREPWPANRDFGWTIRVASERLRQRCRGTWCLYLQANEVVHEAAAPELLSLPARHPTATMFRLPFLSLLGRRQIFQLEFRRRLVRNHPAIQVRGDGFDLGYSALALGVRSPLRLLHYVMHREGEMPVYLSRPVYRYRGLCPENYLRKTAARAEWLRVRERAAAWRQENATATDLAKSPAFAARDPEAFWRALRGELVAQGRWPRTEAETPSPEVDEQPALLEALPERWEYEVQDSLDSLQNHADLDRLDRQARSGDPAPRAAD